MTSPPREKPQENVKRKKNHENNPCTLPTINRYRKKLRVIVLRLRVRIGVRDNRCRHVRRSGLGARHSQPLFATRLCFLFCNQLASARLVIRRAVEIESPRFVSCSWFIGLIGLDTELPKIKIILNQYTRANPHSSPR